VRFHWVYRPILKSSKKSAKKKTFVLACAELQADTTFQSSKK